MRTSPKTIRPALLLAALCALVAASPASAQDAEREGSARGAQEARAATRSPGPREITRDELLAMEVQRRLARSATLAGAQLDVAVEARRVTLRGTVGGEEQAKRATLIVESTPGVAEVTVELQRDPQAVEAHRAASLDDAKAAEELATAMRGYIDGAELERIAPRHWLVHGDEWGFSVEAEDASIFLEGSVEETDHLIHLLRLARRHPGVRDVQSRLFVADLQPMFHPQAQTPPIYTHRPYGPAP